MNRLLKRLLLVLLSTSIPAVCVSCGGGNKTPENKFRKGEITVDNVANSTTGQERWLTVPESRLVINPFTNFTDTETQYERFDSPHLAFSLGYLDPWGKGVLLEDTQLLMAKQDNKYIKSNNYLNTWRPDRLSFTAEYENGAEIEGNDFFYDDKTIVRQIKVKNASDIFIGGKLESVPEIDNNTIFTKGEHYGLAITVENCGTVNFYRDIESMESGTTGLMMYWGAEVKVPEDGEIIISYTLDTHLVSKDEITNQSKQPLEKSDFNEALKYREDYWNDYLTRVPHPEEFSLTSIEELGTTSEDIKYEYYMSWILAGADVLPASPELNYNYRQICCGKPNMWAEGASPAQYSAVWDSYYGMQLLSYIDPDLVWEAYTGMTTLVEKTDDWTTNGMINGESLPTNKAQTLWILYNCKPDKEKLAGLMENISLNIEWCMSHAYWIYQGNQPYDADIFDSYFAAACLRDIQAMLKLYNELGDADNIAKWEEKYDSYMSKFMEKTFFLSPSGKAAGTYLPSSHELAVYLYKLDLEEIYNELLVRIFNRSYKPDEIMFGMKRTKVEGYNCMLYGILPHVSNETARALIEYPMRASAITKIVGEQFDVIDGKVYTTGVRPNMFGAALLIDSVLLRNGYRYDSGNPQLNNYYESGGVKNLMIEGRTLNFSIKGNKASITGNYIENKEIDAEIGRLVDIK